MQKTTVLFFCVTTAQISSHYKQCNICSPHFSDMLTFPKQDSKGQSTELLSVLYEEHK